jgi:hypothetical protein
LPGRGHLRCPGVVRAGNLFRLPCQVYHRHLTLAAGSAMILMAWTALSP